MKDKKDRYEHINEETSPIDYYARFTESIILKFLNFDFGNEFNADDLAEIFSDHYESRSKDELIAILSIDEVINYHHADKQSVEIFFEFLQAEMRTIFNSIQNPPTYFRVKNENGSTRLPQGRFESLHDDIESLGNLRYEVFLGDLRSEWCEKAKGMRQLVLRSMVDFFKDNSPISKNVIECSWCKELFLQKEEGKKRRFCYKQNSNDQSQCKTFYFRKLDIESLDNKTRMGNRSNTPNLSQKKKPKKLT